MEESGQIHVPVVLTPRKNSLYRLGGPQRRSRRTAKREISTGYRTPAVQPEVGKLTESTTAVHHTEQSKDVYLQSSEEPERLVAVDKMTIRETATKPRHFIW
jgi:hypothetical protein